jgi:heme ABC exporter ATP-binding subunit CcmA
VPDNQPAPAVSLRDVVVLLGRFPALAGVDLEIEAASLVLIQGPNGAGKTTLLRCLAGLIPIGQGSGTVLGLDLAGQRREIRRRVALVGHRTGLYGDLTALENLEFVARINRAGVEEVHAAADRLALGARELDTATNRLSAGQRRRTALAAMVLRRPSLWLLDEPHAGLDQSGRKIVDDLFDQAVAAGATVLVASHELERTRARSLRRVTVAAGAIYHTAATGASGGAEHDS